MGQEPLLHVPEGLVPFPVQLGHGPENRFQLFFDAHAGFVVDMCLIDHGEVGEAADTDHKKFIEIIGKD